MPDSTACLLAYIDKCVGEGHKLIIRQQMTLKDVAIAYKSCKCGARTDIT